MAQEVQDDIHEPYNNTRERKRGGWARNHAHVVCFLPCYPFVRLFHRCRGLAVALDRIYGRGYYWLFRYQAILLSYKNSSVGDTS
jgi:hypothetical protein